MLQADAAPMARALRLLVLPACISAVIILAASLYTSVAHTMSLSTLLEVARVTLLTTSFAAGLVIFPIGVIGTLIWAMRMAGELLPGSKPLWIRFNHLNAVFAPQFLTPVGLEHRRKLLTSYGLALVGAVHGIMAIILDGLAPSAT
jgi:hypothetical protein